MNPSPRLPMCAHGRSHLLLVLLALPLLVGAAAGQDPAQAPAGPPAGQNVDREAMWFAPTAEDWARPCLIQWQRTWEDAVAVSEETGKPILVCTNMDGEIASEHYAGVRYRQPGIAALFEPYVPVIASVYRHNPRDYDEEGRRIECPRFGTVTCGEHIAIEPGLFERFFDGQRVAPRHIGVELDGGEMYDVYYAWDTQSIFTALQDGIANRPAPTPIVRGDRTLLERVASRDSKDRAMVEQAYESGDAALRAALLAAAKEHVDRSPMDLLRLAVFGLDTERSKQAREALAEAGDDSATDLIADSLRVPMDRDERERLLTALERIGEQSSRARTLSVVHRGLGNRSDSLDEGGWAKALADVTEPLPAVESYELQSRLRQQDQTLASQDAEAVLQLAEAFLARAFDHRFFADDSATDHEQARLLFLDAQRVGRQAEGLGATGWRLDAVLALSAYYLLEPEEAHQRAEAAVRALPPGEQGWNSMAVLELFAKMRCQAIAKAVEEKKDWSPQWLTDVNAACAVLAKHPLGTDAQVAWHYDILQWLKARSQAGQVLQEGIQRFPDSGDLHQRLRRQVQWEKGVDGLESVYARLVEEHPESPSMQWFAGFAMTQAAEFHRRRGQDEPAFAAYAKALGWFDRCAGVEDWKASADSQAALVLAGQARLHLQREADREALDAMLACLQRCPDAAATPDGLNISPADTARMLKSRWSEAGNADLLAPLEEALGRLDPKLLELPDYERVGPGGRPRPQGRRGQGG